MAKYLKFTVEGSGQFPTDMLRYDSCYPSDQESAVAMGLDPLRNPTRYNERRQVNLTQPAISGMRPHCTPARWITFGWKVIKEEVRSV